MYSRSNSTIRPKYISVSYWLNPPPPQPIHDQLVLTKTIWKMHADGSPRASSPGVFGVLLWGRGPEHRSSPGEFARRLRQCQIFPTFRSSEQHTMKRGQSLR